MDAVRMHEWMDCDDDAIPGADRRGHYGTEVQTASLCHDSIYPLYHTRRIRLLT